jgi:Rhs element Vgr protein
MAIIADKITVRIDGKEEKGYHFSNIQLTQEIQKSSELHFLMHKKSLQENEKDIRFSLSRDLLGKKIEFSLTTSRDDIKGKSHPDKLEFTGIIFNVNALRNSMGAGLIIEVIAYSPDYLLNDSPHCFSYENENLKSIVEKTIQPYDIAVKNDPMMDSEIPYIVQYNETNYQFISRLAQRFGEWLYFDGKELVFGKIKKSDSKELYPEFDILNYQYRLDMEHLNFFHLQHNYLEAENSVSQASSFTKKNMHNMTDIAFEESAKLYKKKTFQTLHASRPEGNTFDESELSAKALGLGKKSQQMICQGCSNRADLGIGSVIKIKEFFNQAKSSCFHDELMICKIIHKSDQNENYENEFWAVPASSEYPPYSYTDIYPHSAPQRAVVKDNKDPEKLGRVRVQFLWQQEQKENLTTPWIRITQPHGGKNKGFYFIPEEEEEVMVDFENGNAEKPYVAGMLYHGSQRPADSWYSDSDDIKAIRTRNGHTIEIHDTGEEGGFIRIYDNEKENYILTYSTDEKLIKLESKGNIELYAENDIIMEAKNNVNIKAGEDMTREAGKNITEDAGENISITVGNDMSTDVSNNDTLNVGQNQTIEIGNNKDESISEKYILNANNIREEASQKIQIYSQTHEQKADNEMKLDGGSGLDLYASNIKIN